VGRWSRSKRCRHRGFPARLSGTVHDQQGPCLLQAEYSDAIRAGRNSVAHAHCYPCRTPAELWKSPRSPHSLSIAIAPTGPAASAKGQTAPIRATYTRLGPTGQTKIPIARPPSRGSFNPASMRSLIAPAQPSAPRDLTEPSRFP
jgi:hypothetical protein